jgi:hypothetical protein
LEFDAISWTFKRRNSANAIQIYFDIGSLKWANKKEPRKRHVHLIYDLNEVAVYELW